MSLRFASQSEPPRGPRHLVHRERLTATLAPVLDRRLVLISAPAGAGKTSVLLDLQQSLDRPLVWLGLDEWLADPFELAKGLAAALEAAAPGAIEAVDKVLNADLSEDVRLRRASVELVATMAGTTGGVLVLDDVHHVSDAVRVSELLDSLISHMPDSWCIVLAGRRLPVLACETRLALDGELFHLPAAQLALTEGETRLLVSRLRGGEISEEAGRKLWIQSGGWAAALVLGASTSIDDGANGGVDGAGVAVPRFDELTRHLLGGMALSEQHLLLRVAVPQVLDAETFGIAAWCDAEGELPVDRQNQHSATALALADRYGFMMRTAGAASAYRLHDLVRELLLSEARRLAPGLVDRIHVELAGLCQTRGDEAGAQYHLRESRSWPELAAAACRVLETMRRQGRWRSVRELIDGLPGEALAAEPLLSLIRAESFCYAGESERALAELSVLSERLAAPDHAMLRARALALRGVALRLAGAHATAVDVSEQAELELLALDAPGSMRAGAQRDLGLAFAAAGKYEDALVVLRQALQVFEALGETGDRAMTHDCIAGVLLQLGCIAEATSHLERARRGWSDLHNGNALAVTLNNLGIAYASLGDVELATEMLTEAKRQAEMNDNERVAVTALLGLADLHRDQEDGREMADLASEALGRARKLDEPVQVLYAMQALAEGHRLIGDLDRAEMLARESVGAAAEQGGDFEQGLAALVLGSVLSSRQAASGIDELRRAVGLIDCCKAATEAIRARFALASALYGIGDIDEAASLVATAAQSTGDLSVESTLRRYAARMPELFKDAASRYGGTEALGQFTRCAGPAQDARTAARRPISRSTASTGDAGGHAALPRITAQAFGKLRVLQNDHEVNDQQWESEKARELLFFLLAHPGAVPGSEIATALWPSLDSDGSRKALYSTVYRLRRALYPECVINLRSSYQLNPEGSFRFDASEFRGLVSEMRGLDGEERRDRAERAVALYSGPIAIAAFGDWADGLRADCEERYLRALTDLSEFYFHHHRLDRAAELATKALAVDPYCESSARIAFECRLQDGDMRGALRAFRRYRECANADGLEATTEFLNRYCEVVSGNYSLAAS